MKPIHALATILCLAACAGPAGSERNDARFDLIRPGMTRDDAMRLFGRPDETMRFPMTATESWDYLYYDTWGVLASYSVTFGADGRVVTRFSRRLNDGGDHGQ
jgi:outer membrane protein assembly factor BamE (lipoprotein component of BamABCDE complex)